MELHPQAQAVLDDMAALGHPPIVEVSPPEARDIRRAHVQPSATGVHEVRNVDAGGVPARLYRPSDEEGLGLEKWTLKPEKMVKLQREDRDFNRAYLKGKTLYMGGSEKALLRLRGP